MVNFVCVKALHPYQNYKLQHVSLLDVRQRGLTRPSGVSTLSWEWTSF